MSTLQGLRALLSKEFRVTRLGLAIVLPICLLQAGTFLIWSVASYVAYFAAVTIAVALAGSFVDSRFGTELLFASLPLRRGMTVAARYLWCALAIGLMLALALGEARLISGLAATRPGALRSHAFGTEEALLFLVLTGLPLALFLPFSFRWGPGGGAARFAPAVGAVAALAALASLATGWDAASFARDRALGLAELIRRVGPAPTLLATVIILAAIGVASGLCSARTYARRDL